MADERREGEDQPPEMEAGVVSVKPPVAVVEREAGALEAAALPLSMVMVQVFTMVMLFLSKLALNTGMRPFVLLVYRNLIAAAAVAALAFIFERDMWKKLNLVVLGWISLNATLGIVLAMGLYYYGLQATNAAYSVMFLNLIPIVTFAIAFLSREVGVGGMAWQDEAPGRSDVCSWDDDSEPAQRPSPAPVALTITPAEIFPCQCAGGERWSPPQHGRRHNVPVRQLPELCLVVHRSGKAGKGVSIKVLGDHVDVLVGKHPILCDRRVPQPWQRRLEDRVGPEASDGGLLGRVQHGHNLRPHLMGGEPAWADLPSHVQLAVNDHHYGDGPTAVRHQHLRGRRGGDTADHLGAVRVPVGKRQGAAGRGGGGEEAGAGAEWRRNDISSL